MWKNTTLRPYAIVGVIVFVSALLAVTTFMQPLEKPSTITDSVDIDDDTILNVDTVTKNNTKHYTIIASDSPTITEP